MIFLSIIPYVCLFSNQVKTFSINLKNNHSTVERHQSESHSRYLEITHGSNIYLLKFQHENECSQFAVKAKRFTDMTSSS